MFAELAISDPLYYFSWVLAAGFSICCHEFAHAWVAVRFGDETPRKHLTLNPLVQMGRTSIFMLLLIGIAWGAVPVNPDAVTKNGRRALISLAGPLMNLVLCALFAFAGTVSIRVGLSDALNQFFGLASFVNGVLFVLNILPVPTLDGYSAIAAFSPRMEWFRRRYAPQIFMVFLALFFLTPLSSLIFGAGQGLGTLFFGIGRMLLGSSL